MYGTLKVIECRANGAGLVFLPHARLRVGKAVRTVIRAALVLPDRWQRGDRAPGADSAAGVARLQERCAADCWYVDPSTIRRRLPKVLNAPVGAVMDERFVFGGYWDRLTVRYRGNPTVHQVFVQRIPIEATKEYRQMKALLEAGRKPRGRETFAEMDAYFQRLFTTYDSIRKQGYLTQRELGISGDNEIGVYVDRRGRLVWARQGDHRLSIARLLGLGAVPVLVRGVHARWMRRCIDEHGGDVARAVLEGLRTLEVSAGGRR